jgi:hypothetical protein
MMLTQILPTIVFVTSAACMAQAQERIPPVGTTVDAASGLVQMSGFVELYTEDGVQLLSGGREITLIGETAAAVAAAGREVRVTGRFVCDNVFRVETVTELSTPVVADTR